MYAALVNEKQVWIGIYFVKQIVYYKKHLLELTLNLKQISEKNRCKEKH